MTNLAHPARLLLLLCLALSFAACSQFKRGAVSEEKDPYFIQGKNRATSMDWDGAVESFTRALQSNPTNAAAHFELGFLFDHHKKDPAAAIYHYERHLALRTNSAMATVIKDQIVACKRALAKEVYLAVAPRDLQLDLERALQTNAILEARIASLQKELAAKPAVVTNVVTNLVQVQMPQFDPRNTRRLTQPAEILQSPAAQIAPEPAEPEARPAPAQPRSSSPAAAASPRPDRRQSPRAAASAAPSQAARKSHTVRPGDTLDVIARRYGVSVSALKAANPSARSGARSGQKLVIPER